MSNARNYRETHDNIGKSRKIPESILETYRKIYETYKNISFSRFSGAGSDTDIM